jgi:hypothetical protein
MARDWRPSGAADGKPTPIGGDLRRQIEDQILASGIGSPVPEAFFSALEQAGGAIEAAREMLTSSGPARVRENLTKALSAARRLDGALHALDLNSVRLFHEIDEARPFGIGTVHAQCLNIVIALEKALVLANQYPLSGRLHDAGRVWLAIGVADAIESFLGVKASTTKSGLFESITIIVYQAATGENVTDQNDLVRRALKLRHEWTKSDRQGQEVEPE